MTRRSKPGIGGWRRKTRAPGLLLGLLIAAGCMAAGSCAKTQPAKNDTRPVQGETVVETPFGDDPGAVGHDIPEEGMPIGPSSFVVDDGGKAYVLDQVNSRIQVFQNGKHLDSIAIPSAMFEDLDFQGDGFVLLNKYAEGALVFVDKSGKQTGSVPIAGDGIEAATAVTAIFSRDDGVWVETDEGDCLRLTDESGRPVSERKSVGGRLSADGKVVFRQEVVPEDKQVLVYRSEGSDGDTEVFAAVSFEEDVGVTELEVDAEGTVYLTAVLHGSEEVRLEAVVLSDKGEEVSRQNLPPPAGEEEMLRTVRLGRDGVLYSMRTTENGLEIAKVSP